MPCGSGWVVNQITTYKDIIFADEALLREALGQAGLTIARTLADGSLVVGETRYGAQDAITFRKTEAGYVPETTANGLRDRVYPMRKTYSELTVRRMFKQVGGFVGKPKLREGRKVFVGKV